MDPQVNEQKIFISILNMLRKKNNPNFKNLSKVRHVVVVHQYIILMF